MRKIKEFDRKSVAEIMAACEEALRPVAEKYGLTLERQGRTYYRDHLPVKFQLHVAQEDAEGNAMDSKAKDFVRLAKAYGLAEEDYLAEFRSNGRTFRITGLNTRARGYPVLAEDVRSGKTYKFPVERVKRALAQSRAA